jgi:hypothetical protein
LPHPTTFRIVKRASIDQLAHDAVERRLRLEADAREIRQLDAAIDRAGIVRKAPEGTKAGSVQ